MNKNLTKILSLVLLCFLLGNDMAAQEWVYDCETANLTGELATVPTAAAATDGSSIGITDNPYTITQTDETDTWISILNPDTDEEGEFTWNVGTVGIYNIDGTDGSVGIYITDGTDGVYGPVGEVLSDEPCESEPNSCGVTAFAPRRECGCPTNLEPPAVAGRIDCPAVYCGDALLRSAMLSNDCGECPPMEEVVRIKMCPAIFCEQTQTLVRDAMPSNDCGECPPMEEIECPTQANCAGIAGTVMSECGICPPLEETTAPAAPVEIECPALENCKGEKVTVMSECGVCPAAPIPAPLGPEEMICYTAANCAGDVTPYLSTCGVCIQPTDVTAPADPLETQTCPTQANCAGETGLVMTQCGVCPPVSSTRAPANPVEIICSSAPNCKGDVTTVMSECGVCPTNIEAPPCPAKCPTTCPPFTYQDPFTCECLSNPFGEECVVFPCDDGDPCTSGDVEERKANGDICVPCAGAKQEVLSVEVLNMRDCDDNGTADPSDDTFTGDIAVTFNYEQPLGDFIITGDSYYSYTEDFNKIDGSVITIPNRIFDADGGPITLHVIFNDRLSCSYTRNNLGGTALASCSEGSFNSTESSLVADKTRTALANTNMSKVAARDMTVFPNPAQDELFVQFAGLDLTSAVKVQLFDMSGRQQLVREISIPTTLLPINIGDLENGMYLIRLEQNGIVMTDRIVKSAK